MSVEEILARHQARQVAERDRSPRYVVNGRIQQYFRPTVTDPGFDVITENRFFVDRVEGTEWEERDFSVNGAHFGEPRPPFPLLQPEKVLSPPLSIDLDDRYRYRLAGHRRRQRAQRLGHRLRAARAQRVAVPRHRLDRSRVVRAAPTAGGADGAVGTGDLQRRDAGLRARAAGLGRRRLAAVAHLQPAVDPDCRAEPAGRAAHHVQRLRTRARGLRRAAPGGARRRLARCTATRRSACGTS